MKAQAGGITVRLITRHWQVIDAELDNVVAVAVEIDYQGQKIEMGEAIRQAGWEQVPWVNGNQWPPVDQPITITLSREQWMFALAALDESDATYESLGDRESLELGRAARAAVGPQVI
jgi:hypothetical protein